MNKNKLKLNIVALICAIVMPISCFLPWAEVSSHSSVMGYSSSYNSSVSGIQSGVGFIGLILGTFCLILVLLRSRFMVIPGVLNLIFSFFQASGMEDIASNVSTSYGEGHAGPSFGIYVLFISSLIYVVFTAIALIRSQKKQPIIESQTTNGLSAQEIKIPEPVIIQNEPISPNIQSESPLPNVFINKSTTLSKFQKAMIIVGVIIGIYALIFMWADTSSEKFKNEQEASIANEQYRLEQIIKSTNEAVSNKQYEVAMVNINSLKWMLNSDANYIEQYDKIKEDFASTVQQLIIERELAIEEEKKNQEELASQQQKDSIERYQPETEPPSFPFDMMVIAEKSYFYSEPDVNSDRLNFVTKNSVLTVMANQYEFLYCKYKNPDGSSLSGWVYSKDISRIE
jgi:hypothetical protein